MKLQRAAPYVLILDPLPALLAPQALWFFHRKVAHLRLDPNFYVCVAAFS